MNVIFLVVWFLLLFAGVQVYAQSPPSPCEECLKASQDELKHCLDNAISQEDKISCGDNQDAQAKVCENDECKTERAQNSKRGEASPEKK